MQELRIQGDNLGLECRGQSVEMGRVYEHLRVKAVGTAKGRCRRFHLQRVLSSHMGYTYPNHRGNHYYRNHTLSADLGGRVGWVQ